MRPLIALALCSLLSACAGSPNSLARGNPAELRAATLEQLCFAYSFSRAEAVRGELERREALSALDWQHVPAGRVAIGMTEPGVMCALGTPTAINRTATRGGTWKQWVYPRGGRTIYVYTEDGKVTSWQD